MESGVTLMEHSDNSEIVEVNDSFCEASRFTLALASHLGLQSDTRSDVALASHLGLQSDTRSDVALASHLGLKCDTRSDEQIEFADSDLIGTKDIIEILKTIESKKKNLLEIRYTTKQCQSLIEAEDIINADVHLKQCRNLGKIIDHMSLIIKESEQLRNRLQSPLMSDALNIHSSHHRYVLQLFSTISSHFKEFQFHLDTISKGSKLDFRAVGNEHDVILLEAKKQIAELQMAVHYLETFRSSLNKLYLIKCQNPLEMIISNSL